MTALENGQAFTLTEFYGVGASRKTEKRETLDSLKRAIETTTRRKKADLPWLKMATFGDRRTEADSLRHDANIIEVTGCEADYDGEQVPPEEAVERLTKAGVLGIVYTSPSHTPEKPRWRVLCPFSKPYPSHRRQAFLGRLNGLLGGILAGESWTLSQSYYYGRVGDNPAHKVETIEGDAIDLHDDLDEIWTGKANTGSAKPNATGMMQSGPVDEAALLQEIEDGKSYHTAMVRLLGRWAMSGVPLVAAKARLLDAMEVTFPPDRDARWHDRRADMDRCIEYVYGKEDAKPKLDKEKGANGKPGTESLRPWRIVNPVELEHKPVPERVWIVPGWIPTGVVTSLYADGGVGKTLLGMQLQFSTALSAPWCGLAVRSCRSFGLYCEDDEDELHRRAARMCDHYGVGFGQLENMRWISGFGCDNALMEPSDYRMHVTSRLPLLEAGIKEHGAELAILDVAADLFVGNENDRSQVRAFIAALNALAGRCGCGILLNAHPSRTGLADKGDLDGGSTAWNNGVRSRLALSRPKMPDGEPEDRDARVLTTKKANYGAIGSTIKLRWQDGVFVPEMTVGGFAALASQADAETVFMTLLARTVVEDRPMSDSRNSGNSAPKIFSQRPDRQGFTRKDFEGAMQRLFAAGKIRMAEYGRAGSNGRPRRIKVVDAG